MVSEWKIRRILNFLAVQLPKVENEAFAVRAGGSIINQIIVTTYTKCSSGWFYGWQAFNMITVAYYVIFLHGSHQSQLGLLSRNFQTNEELQLGSKFATR